MLKVFVSRYVVNGACFAVDTDGIGCETALKVPVLRYVVTGGCIGGDTDRIDCETALPLLVRSQSRMLDT